MPELEKVIKGLAACMPQTEDDAAIGCKNCPYHCGGNYQDNDHVNLPVALIEDVRTLLKAQEPRVLAIDLPDAEWNDKVIWLEVKGKKVTPCLLRECGDRMMFGRYERLMYFDVIGSAFESGYMLKNYGVKWRCWSQRPNDAQREATPWRT